MPLGGEFKVGINQQATNRSKVDSAVYRANRLDKIRVLGVNALDGGWRGACSHAHARVRHYGGQLPAVEVPGISTRARALWHAVFSAGISRNARAGSNMREQRLILNILGERAMRLLFGSFAQQVLHRMGDIPPRQEHGTADDLVVRHLVGRQFRRAVAQVLNAAAPVVDFPANQVVAARRGNGNARVIWLIAVPHSLAVGPAHSALGRIGCGECHTQRGGGPLGIEANFCALREGQVAQVALRRGLSYAIGALDGPTSPGIAFATEAIGDAHLLAVLNLDALREFRAVRRIVGVQVIGVPLVAVEADCVGDGRPVRIQHQVGSINQLNVFQIALFRREVELAILLHQPDVLAEIVLRVGIVAVLSIIPAVEHITDTRHTRGLGNGGGGELVGFTGLVQRTIHRLANRAFKVGVGVVHVVHDRITRLGPGGDQRYNSSKRIGQIIADQHSVIINLAVRAALNRPACEIVAGLYERVGNFRKRERNAVDDGHFGQAGGNFLGTIAVELNSIRDGREHGFPRINTVDPHVIGVLDRHVRERASH